MTADLQKMIPRIYTAISKSVNWGLQTFDSQLDRDVEGLSLRVEFLLRIAENDLIDFDISNDSPKGDKKVWIDFYLDKLLTDMKKMQKSYVDLLLGAVQWRTREEKETSSLDEYASLVYSTIDYENIFLNCNYCPRKLQCFCEFKTFLVCLFDNQLVYDVIHESHGLKELMCSEVTFGINDRRDWRSAIPVWLRSNVIERTDGRKGYPYLIPKSMSAVIKQYPELAYSEDKEDGLYKNIDPYITASLLRVISNKRFRDYFVLSIPEDTLDEMLKTIKEMQKDKEDDKSFLIKFRDEALNRYLYSTQGTWDEGFWGGRKVQRVISTCSIASTLYQFDGWSNSIESALRFVLRALGNPQNNGAKRYYLLDDASFRDIDATAISNMSGTIGAIGFLLKIREGERVQTSKVGGSCPELEWLLGPKGAAFIIDEISWLLIQQRESGAFPILSEDFIEMCRHERFLKETLKDKKARQLHNVSLNNTFSSTYLLIDFVNHILGKYVTEKPGEIRQELERVLRRFVFDRLVEHYGEQWLQGIPPEIRDYCRKRQEDDKSPDKNKKTVLDYSTLGHLKHIIAMNYNWENVFKNHIRYSTKDAFIGVLDILIELRQKEAHGRLTKVDAKRLQRMSEELTYNISLEPIRVKKKRKSDEVSEERARLSEEKQKLTEEIKTVNKALKDPSIGEDEKSKLQDEERAIKLKLKELKKELKEYE